MCGGHTQRCCSIAFVWVWCRCVGGALLGVCALDCFLSRSSFSPGSCGGTPAGCRVEYQSGARTDFGGRSMVQSPLVRGWGVGFRCAPHLCVFPLFWCALRSWRVCAGNLRFPWSPSPDGAPGGVRRCPVPARDTYAGIASSVYGAESASEGVGGAGVALGGVRWSVGVWVGWFLVGCCARGVWRRCFCVSPIV